MAKQSMRDCIGPQRLIHGDVFVAALREYNAVLHKSRVVSR
jgi:hypothetical protein